MDALYAAMHGKSAGELWWTTATSRCTIAANSNTSIVCKLLITISLLVFADQHARALTKANEAAEPHAVWAQPSQEAALTRDSVFSVPEY